MTLFIKPSTVSLLYTSAVTTFLSKTSLTAPLVTGLELPSVGVVSKVSLSCFLSSALSTSVFVYTLSASALLPISKAFPIAYAWYEFEKGYKGDTKIKWIN